MMTRILGAVILVGSLLLLSIVSLIAAGRR